MKIIQHHLHPLNFIKILKVNIIKYILFNYINMTEHKILNCDGIQFMKDNVEDNSVDLVLVDPPYAISKDTGMDKFHKSVIENEGKNAKTEKDWDKYKETLKKPKEETAQEQ